MPKRASSTAAGLAAPSTHEAALLLKLKELTGGVDPEASDEAWLETLVVTSAQPLACDDPQDDLKRELALCARPRRFERSRCSRTHRLTRLRPRPTLACGAQLQPGTQCRAYGAGAL